MDRIPLAAARRIALAAQGFGRAHPAAVGTRQLTALVGRLGLLQLDSVNVFDRSHYLPVLARLGPYDKALLDRMAFERRGSLIEYWAHEAALIPRRDWPLWHFKREALRARDPDRYPWAREHRPLLDWLLVELARTGPVTATQIEHDANRRRGPWWGWSDVKHGLEFLFRWGDVVSAGRNGFQRVYALPEHVPSLELSAPPPSRQDAVRELVRRSAVALGVGSVADIADYHRLPVAETASALLELAEAGVVERVAVEGWMRGERPLLAYRATGARMPRRIESTALLSPFDPIVWNRDRALRLFGFHYRIEIYTPEAQRRFGYYTLPVLVDDALPGRIDLKSDRQAGILRVQSAWVEDDASAGAMAGRIAPVLRSVAAWQGLSDVVVADRGDAAAAVRAALDRG